MYTPLGVAAVEETTRSVVLVEPAETDTKLGLTVATSPATNVTVADSLTAPFKPTLVMPTTVEDGGELALKAGIELDAIEKSQTVTTIVAECVIAPLVPVSVTV